MKNDQHVRMIPINQVRVINSRARDKKCFDLITTNISNVGLKKPITVSRRQMREGEGMEGYDLVCGQGRMEAFMALGASQIPAIILDVPKEDRLLMSLVENLARRPVRPMELIQEVQRLKKAGYDDAAIAKKLDISNSYISGIHALIKAGEERLLQGVLNGKIPMHTAITIARLGNEEAQKELLQAFDENQLSQRMLRSAKRILEERKHKGKQLGQSGRKKGTGVVSSATSIVRAYQKEAAKKHLVVKKNRVCESKLLFVVAAIRDLLNDRQFCQLLQTESLNTLPKVLTERIKSHGA